MREKHSESFHNQTILKWASRFFLIISVMFALIIVPLFIRIYNNISELEMSKRKQYLHNGTNKISSTVTGLLNISSILQNDNNFGMLRYNNFKNITVPVVTQNIMKKTLQNMILPYETVSHIAVQYDEERVITDKTVYFKNRINYYPAFFQVNDLSWEEWVDYLSGIGIGFSDVCHIKTPSLEYDALIIVIPWSNDAYLYACLDIAGIKEQIIEEGNINDCFFTIESADKRVLYTDFVQKTSKYKTISEVSSSGNIKISVHISDTLFDKNMKSFYVPVIIYICICTLFFVLMNIIGTRKISKPIINIINILEQSKNLKSNRTEQSDDFTKGFEYISNILIDADKNIGKYQKALSTQHKIVQARFFEKAINGQLISENDIQSFYYSFPDFPDSFILVSIKFWTFSDKYAALLYEEPLLLIQSFLQSELSVIYQQQISSTELLLLFKKDSYDNSRKTLEFLISNINTNEPTYNIRCTASDVYNSVDDLSTAYQQLCSTDGMPLKDYQTQIRIASDVAKNYKATISVADIMTLSSAVISGNSKLALAKLAACSRELNYEDNALLARPIYDIIKSMLLYIKANHPQSRVKGKIPDYDGGADLYDSLSETIKAYCALINENKGSDNNFSYELLNYIDEHYTDPDICIAKIKTDFNCSESTLRKAFKQITDMSIAHYIEQKRMLLANELLNKKSSNVSEIAKMCGYDLPHSFYKAYKRFYGHAPTVKNNPNGDFYE